MDPLIPDLPDHIGVTEVATESFEHLRVEALMDGQPSLMLDEPLGFDIDAEHLRGQSRGWTPVHAQLAGLAGCTAITVRVAAFQLGFRLDGLSTRIRSLIDIRGFMADFDRRPEFLRIDFDLVLTTGESAERIAALADETDRRCPQLGLYHRARVPLLMRWFRAGEERPAATRSADGADRPDPRLSPAREA